MGRQDGDKSAYVGDREKDRYPLLQMRKRPIPARVLALAEGGPFRSPIWRGRQPLFERADDSVLGRIELPVRTHQPEPRQALGAEDDDREDQQPRGRVRGTRPEGADEREYRRVEREEERIGQPAPGANAVCHLDIDFILLQQGSRITLRLPGRMRGIRALGPETTADLVGCRR